MNNTRRWTYSILTALGVVMASLGWGAAAFANNIVNMVGNPNYDFSCTAGNDGGGGGTQCRTDNANWTYYMDSSGTYALEAEDRQAVSWSMNNRYDPTDLTVSYDSNPTFSGTAETDLIWQEGAINVSTDGVTWCNDPGADYACDQHYIRIRGAGVYSTRLTCHEAGHAVGLLHGANAFPQTSNTDPVLGCMQTPVPTNELGTNQINRINIVY